MSQKPVYKIVFRLAQLRARLCQAWEEGNLPLAARLSARIDAAQLNLWRREIKDREKAI